MGLQLSWLERTPDKREVTSSSLVRPTTFFQAKEKEKTMEKALKEKHHGGVAQLGEHLPCKQGVESSNLFVSIRKENFRASETTEGLQLSRLERTPDKREVGGSSPLKPTGFE